MTFDPNEPLTFGQVWARNYGTTKVMLIHPADPDGWHTIYLNPEGNVEPFTGFEMPWTGLRDDPTKRSSNWERVE